MSRTAILLATATIAATLLAGCSNPGKNADNSPTSTPTATTPTTSTVSTSPGAGSVTVSCDAAPISLVSATLNLPLFDVTTQSLGGVAWCNYGIRGAGSVLLLMQ